MKKGKSEKSVKDFRTNYKVFIQFTKNDVEGTVFSPL